MKLSAKLERIQRATPHRHSSGMLYARKDQLNRVYRRVNMLVLLLSIENTHMIHSAVFQKLKYRSPDQWADWFSRNFSEVYTNGILPGIALRTGKPWSVERIIGWIGNAKYSAAPPRVARRGNKAQSKRRARG